MKDNQGIRVEQVRECALCGKDGQLLYVGLRDRLFDALGVWNLYVCPKCRLIWMNPRPVVEDIGKLYTNYYTHSLSKDLPKFARTRRFIDDSILCAAFGYSTGNYNVRREWLGKILAGLSPLRSMSGMRIMYLDGSRKGRVLDVGCGSGGFLAQMRGLGWEVLGVEPDAEAARTALEQSSIPVTVGTLERAGLPSNSFDAVTMRHVVEHLSDPIGTLLECYRLLKPGGIVAVATPNGESLGHRIFKRSWRGLEVPRHLWVFSSSALCTCMIRAGFNVRFAHTSGRLATGIYVASRMLRYKDKVTPRYQYARTQQAEGFLFRVVEESALLFGNNVGEELLVVGQKTVA